MVLGAAALIAIGALGDHMLFASSGQAPVASGKATPSQSATNALTSDPAVKQIKQTAQIVSAGPTSLDQATEHAYAVASPSVVFVDNVGTGTGSGIIYDTNGNIVTNDHVAAGASSLKVTLSDGRVFPAHIVGTDPSDDLAVIHINASGLKPAKFAAAGTFHVAQMVLAIGSPLGLKMSVTSGLISGLNRVEQEPDQAPTYGAYLPNAIQTSAAINPGNSGGALVSLSGVVVGMPTMVQTSTSDGTAAQDVGFAIPSTRITKIASQIISTGKVIHTGRAYMGIAPADATGQSADPFSGGFFGPGNGNSSPTVEGALVQQISPSGPAAKAGIQQGDVITKVDGSSITSAQDLLTILAQKKPGDTISVTVNRNGSTETVQVHLGELPG
jgi:S1-C subfamily serine protease